MRRYCVNTLGCKVNQYESQQIRELLERLGLCEARSLSEHPDLIVVNTCCVTHTASAKSRQCIRRAQRLNPDALIVVCGCLPSMQIGELSDPIENVHLIGGQESLAATLNLVVTGSRSFHSNPHTIIRAESSEKIKHKNLLIEQSGLQPVNSFRGHTRAFLKVQDGCDGYCSYCIIPKTRPRLWSKAPAAALQEAQSLVAAGHREIVVTGIFLGAYGQESVRRRNHKRLETDKLAGLLEKMARIPGLARIRLSSLEPRDVTPRLLDVFCEHRNIMPHMHLSLQSGSNRVLNRMRRQYTAEEFGETAELVKGHLDRPAITTDIIVGFPGETDADFEQTAALATEVGFAKMHVFSFSPREGTAAARMQDVVDKRVTKERSRILRQLDKNLGWKFHEQFVGQTAVVLLENNDGYPAGRSERYFTVRLENGCPGYQKNDLVKVRLIGHKNNGMSGQAIMKQS